MKILKILILLWLILVTFNVSELFGQRNLTQIDVLENYNLEQGYLYAMLESNSDYLVIKEFMTSTVHVYQLETGETKKIKLPKGRGPNEVGIITAIMLQNNNIMLLNDAVNMKILVYDLNTGEFKDDIKLNDLQIHRADSAGDHLFAFVTGHRESLFHILDLNSGQSNPIDMDMYKIEENFIPFIKREGYLSVNGDYGIFMARYYPEIFVTNFSENKISQKIEFDQVSKIQSNRTAPGGNGMMRAPTQNEVDILVKDFVTIESKKNNIYFLAEGEGEYYNYSDDKLYEISIQNPEKIVSYDLGVESEFISVNEDFMFIYSKETSKVYKYRLDF